jgi:SOS-response transcriptional repressor LexA
MKLTSKQKTILDTIEEYVERKSENPNAYRLHKYLEAEGVQAGALKSTTQVLEALEKKDLIKRGSDKKIYIIENKNFSNLKNIFSIPAYGLASCGEALAYADENNVDGYLQVSKSLFRKEEPAKLFAVKALGDSMDKEKINDGDYVVFEKVEGNFNFEDKIVVAVINGMATIKKYRKFKNGMVGLFPNSKNSTHQPIYLDESDQILIAGVFRRVLPVKYTSL